MPVARSAWSDIGRLTRRETLSMQSEKLHRYLNEHVVPFSAYYNRLYREHRIDVRKIKTVEDLKHLPFTVKSDLAPTAENPLKPTEFILVPSEEKIRNFCPLGKQARLFIEKIVHGQESVTERLKFEYQPVLLTMTTGRSAAPVGFYYSRHDIRLMEGIGRRQLELVNVTTGDRGVNMFPFAPHLAFWIITLACMQAGVMLLSTGGGKVVGTAKNIQAIERIGPALLAGVPGFVYHLLRTAHEQKADFSSVRIVLLGAERVAAGSKERMREYLMDMGAKDPRIIGTYAFTEAKTAWGECLAPAGISSGYHLYTDLGLFEVVDPQTGQVKGEGEDGELVYTSLDARGSVVIRYRTGDYVKGGIVWKPCPYCGWTVPRISSSIDRSSNIKSMTLSKIKGTLVDLNNLALLMMGMPEVDEWQIELRKKNDDPLDMDEVHLYVAAKAGAVEGLEAKIRERMLAEVEVAPNRIVFVRLPEILERLGMETELKEKRIVDARPKDQPKTTS